MDTFFIFGAKYLFLASIALTLYILWKYPSEKKDTLRFLLVSLPLTYLVGKLASLLYTNPRPFVVEGFKPLISHLADNGFPSEHTLLVAALATAMSFFHRRFAIYMWIIALVVAVSRVYVGVHHLLDVVTSIVIAVLCGILTRQIWRKMNYSYQSQ